MEKSTTGITCSTFCQRLLRCSFYKEKDTYVKGARLLFERVLRNYDGSRSIIELFADEFSNRSYTGVRRIYTEDKKMFRDFCVKCAINMNNLFSNNRISNIMENYNWKWKIKGYIGGIIHGKRDLNLQFVYKNVSETHKTIDMSSLNNYIYNEATGKSNDALVMSVPMNGFFLVPYNERDYTIQRGFATFVKGNKLRRPGEHCKHCKEDCKPTFINGLERIGEYI